MYIGIDFDGTIVSDDHAYEDLNTPLTFKPGAKEALLALKAAGHFLLLWSARASRAHLEDPTLDPFVRAGVRPLNALRWTERLPLQQARFDQMVTFIERELPGVFVIDDGLVGKPSVDLFIDDRALRLGESGRGVGWHWIATVYGAVEDGSLYSSSTPP